MNKHTRSDTRPIMGFSLPSDLPQQVDRLAEAEFLTRAAWLRRTVAQAVREAVKTTKVDAA
jgi:predicted transcriptional regulator